MPYFFSVLDFLEGRLTEVGYTSDRLWPEDTELVLLGQFIDLPSGQHVDVESDFLTSHLPYRRAGFGGVYPNGDPWLFVVQAAPAAAELDPQGDPFALMRRSTRSVLGYNAEAELKLEAEWTRDDLIEVYENSGINVTEVLSWSTFELLRGLLAELCSVDLAQIVSGYPACAFPHLSHQCQYDVFNDVFVAWTQRLHS